MTAPRWSVSVVGRYVSPADLLPGDRVIADKVTIVRPLTARDPAARYVGAGAHGFIVRCADGSRSATAWHASARLWINRTPAPSAEALAELDRIVADAVASVPPPPLRIVR